MPVIVILVAIAIGYQYLKLHPEIWYYIHLGEKPFVALVYAAIVIPAIIFVWLFLKHVLWRLSRLFRRPRPELPVVLPSSQWSFDERWKLATNEVDHILQRMKDYADGHHTVTDDMWSAMREWGLDLYLTFLRKDGYADDAYNYIYITLQRHVEHLPENLPLGSYLRVPLTDIIEQEPDNAPYNVPYKKLYDVLVPYAITQELRYEGVWAPARPGSSKTNLLHCMVEENMPEVAAGKASVFIMDSKSNDRNGLVDTWRSIDYEREWGIKNVYYFQASDNLAINVFDLGDIDQIVPLFEYMLSELTGHDISGPQRNLLTNCLHVIKASDAPSIPALRDLLANGAEKHLQAIYRTRDHIKEFFTKSLPETDGRRTQNLTPFESAHHRPTRTAVLERLHALLSFSDKLYDTLVSTKTEIDLRKLIDQGSVIIVNAKLSDLGSKGSELWQRWWTMMLLEAGRHRYSQSPLYIYFDEGHRGIARDTKVSEILEEMRSACFAVTIAHQGDWQIQDPSVLRSLQGLSAITLRATGERGVFNAKVYEKNLTFHVAEAGVRYRKRLSGRKERKHHETVREQFSNKAAPPLVPLLTFIGPELPEPEIIHPEPVTGDEPEPFRYTGTTVVTDAEYEVIDDELPSSGWEVYVPGAKPRGNRIIVRTEDRAQYESEHHVLGQPISQKKLPPTTPKLTPPAEPEPEPEKPPPQPAIGARTASAAPAKEKTQARTSARVTNKRHYSNNR